jgi:hypothetical protein
MRLALEPPRQDGIRLGNIGRHPHFLVRIDEFDSLAGRHSEEGEKTKRYEEHSSCRASFYHFSPPYW